MFSPSHAPLTRLDRRRTLQLLSGISGLAAGVARRVPAIHAQSSLLTRPGTPLWIDANSLDIHAPVEPVWLTAAPGADEATTDVLLAPGSTDLQMGLPSAPDVVGWYALGNVPGEPGSCLLVGHLDTTTGPAIFARLPAARLGTTFDLAIDAGQQVTFGVDAIWRHPAREPAPAELIAPVGPSRLYLVTCTGRFVRSAGGYQERLIVGASLV